MELNEQFIVDGRGSKQAVVIPFANYLKLLDVLRRYDEPANGDDVASVWQSRKGDAQAVRAWLASEANKNYPLGNPQRIDQSIQEIRDAWGDE